MTLRLDRTQSIVRIRTFAEGLFSRLAHDLELVCSSIDGRAEGSSATIEVAIGAIEIAGTLKNGRLDPDGVSASDKSEILAKMRRDVFHGDGVVRVDGQLAGTTATVRVTPPNGPAVEKTIPLMPSEENGNTRIKGMIDLSLGALGSDPIRAPMNAFRMKDRVEVHFDVVFQPA